MATKNLIPASTMVYNLFDAMYRLLVFVFICNPLTMFVINLFTPRKAASLAKNERYCGSKVLSFYRKLAGAYRFSVRKWWLDPKTELAKCSDTEQMIYYEEVDSSDEVLEAMSPHAAAIFLCTGGRITANMRKDEALFAELLATDCYPSEMYHVIKCFFEGGTLPRPLQEVLVNHVIAAPTERGAAAERGLCEYVENCGISQDLQKLIKDKATLATKQALFKSLNIYEQKCKIRALQGEDKAQQWIDYCRTQELHYSVQSLLTLEQLKLFYQHTDGYLAPEVVTDIIISQGGKDGTKLLEVIFTNERDFGHVTKRVGTMLKENVLMADFRNNCIAQVADKLQSLITTGATLSVRQVDQLLALHEYDGGGELVMQYIEQRELEGHQHGRLLNFTNAKELITVYHQKYTVNNGVYEIAVDKGWLS